MRSPHASRRRLRLLGATVASLLLLASAVAIDRSPRGTGTTSDDGPAAGVSPAPSDPGTAEVPAPLPEPSPAAHLLADPAAAAAAGADRLLAAGVEVAQGPWASLGDPAWPTAGERPVYVGEVSVPPAGDAVTADVVIATRLTEATDTVLLRALFAASVLGPGTGLEVAATVDGTPTQVAVDRAGARLAVPLGRERRAGEAVLLRLDVRYRLVAPERITDDGGPAAFGLLAVHPEVTTLGHWLPLLTLATDRGPMVSWGDVGGFPAAVWSLRTVHDGLLVTGGADGPCPPPTERTCTWSRGIALRDVSAALYPSAPVVAEAAVDGIRHRAVSADGTRDEAAAVVAEQAAATRAFASRLGPLAWRELDAVSVPLGRGAAGMEFPGLSFIDDAQWTRLEGAFGTAVVVHEVAHQWFHALVGNGSLSSPVVDESLAQYLTYLYWGDAFGEPAARAFADRAFRQRYRRAVEEGLGPAPPAQPLDGFAGADAYGPLVYARAPLAWVAAETELGVERVEAFLQQVVAAHALGEVGDRELIEEATGFDPRLGAVLRRYWLEPAPVG